MPCRLNKASSPEILVIWLRILQGTLDLKGVPWTRTSWWRHQMETEKMRRQWFETLLRSLWHRRNANVTFNRVVVTVHWIWYHRWFETPSRSLWRHCNGRWRLCSHDSHIDGWLVAWRFFFRKFLLDCRFPFLGIYTHSCDADISIYNAFFLYIQLLDWLLLKL